tara:strand:- start:2103 stop:2954 length:852 start_codon:yes stop_codon:yes gene_type:complete
MQNILITGSSGFIGSNILLNIFNKHNIYITSRSKISIKLKELKVIHYKNHLDLNKKLKKIKIDIIIHCGTHYVKNHNVSDINKLTLANIEFGVILLENLKSMGVKKFINFSTVWQNYNGKQDIAYNLYSAFKLSYSKILDYYIGKYSFIRFYNLFISDTYGENDNRSKIINLIKQNIRNKKKIRIVSKKLSMNLLNVKDIVAAVRIIVDKNVKPGKYNITNNKNIKIYNLIKKIKKVKKIKNLIKFENNSFKNDRIFYYKKLPGWQPRYSSFKDLIRFVLGQS